MFLVDGGWKEDCVHSLVYPNRSGLGRVGAAEGPGSYVVSRGEGFTVIKTGELI